MQTHHTLTACMSCLSIGVNVPPSQHLYRALVSVNVEEEELISQALRDRLQLVSPKCSHGNKAGPSH